MTELPAETVSAPRADGASDARTRRLLRAQIAVARLLAAAPPATAITPLVLKSVCEELGWAFGAMWEPDDDGDLRATFVWARDPVGLSAFIGDTRALKLAPGRGLPGRVWQSGNSAWLNKITEDPNFPRIRSARHARLESAFAVTVTGTTTPVGVLEFFTHEHEEPDDDLLETIEGVGQQFGQLLERRTAEEAVVASEALKAAILASSLDAIISMDATGRITEFNRAAVEMFGFSRAQALGQPMADLIVPPALREDHHRGLARYLTTGIARILDTRVEIDARRADGSIFPVELTITRVGHAGAPVFTGFVRDITTRRRNEKRQELFAALGATLSESLEVSKTLDAVARLAVPFFADYCLIDVTQPDGSLRRAAGAHADATLQPLVDELLEFPPNATGSGPVAMSMKLAQPVVVAELPDEAIQATARGDRHRKLLEMLNPTGYVVLPLLTHGVVLGAISLIVTNKSRRIEALELDDAADFAGRAALAVNNARLYEEAVRMETELRQASRVKDEFLGLVSHELRTPLTTILGNAKALVRHGDKLSVEARSQVYLDLQADAERLQALVENMLLISRMERGTQLELEPVLLGRFVARVMESFRSRYPSRRFEVSGADGSVVAMAETSSLQQALENLLSNALKYSAKGSPVELFVGADGERAWATVADRGVGIDPAEPIFEAFYRRPESAEVAEGLGLGLSVCVRLMEAQGGSVTARPREGGGSEFTLWLPLLDADRD